MSNKKALRIGAGVLVTAAIAVLVTTPLPGPPGDSIDVQHLVIQTAGADEYAAGQRFLQGVQQPKDEALALAHFQNAAREGHPEAQYQLSRMFAEGIGTKVSAERSLMWLHIAAESGAPEAQLQLGMAFLEGRRLPMDPVQAYAWLSLAATHGVVGAAIARDAALSAMSPAEATAAKVHVDRLSLRTSVGFGNPERVVGETSVTDR